MKKIILYDINKELCNCWQKYFKDIQEVEVRNEPFQLLEFEKVVTAGNSYGWMTGGIDLVVRDYYGQQIQDAIQSNILSMPGRFLPVGESIIIQTHDKKKPYLIYAPTMNMPKQIDKIDCFYIFAKLLEKYDSFACCGIGTCTGEIAIEECAKAMYDAYKYIYNN